MGKHDHIQSCNHDIKYCNKCDTCYCTICDKEWRSSTRTYWQYRSYYYTTPQWTATYDGTAIKPGEGCNHRT